MAAVLKAEQSRPAWRLEIGAHFGLFEKQKLVFHVRFQTYGVFSDRERLLGW